VWARHRVWAGGLIVGGVVAGLLVGGLAHAADPPTVTFSGGDLLGLACGSRPDVDSVSVSEGTAVTVANDTGATARVVVSGQTVLTLEDGAAGALTLAAGSHQVVLVPQCLLVTLTAPLTVTVTPAPAPPSPSPESSPPSEDPPTALAPAAPGESTSGEDGVVVGGRAPAPKRMPGGTPVPSVAGSPSASAGTSSWPTSGRSEVAQAEVVPWSKPEDPKGVRLLAVIAAICVLGVTAAIIRSIVRLDA